MFLYLDQLTDHVIAMHWHRQSQALEKSQDAGPQPSYRSAGCVAQGKRPGQEQSAARPRRRVDELQIHRDIERHYESTITTGKGIGLGWGHAWLGVSGAVDIAFSNSWTADIPRLGDS